jgi:chloride channel protein, CIC family
MRLRLRLRLLGTKLFSGDRAHGLLPAAALVGVIGGLTVLAFRSADQLLQEWWLGAGDDAATATAGLGPVRRVATATLGGLGAGFALLLAKRASRHKGSADYMEAVTLGDGVIRIRPTLARALSSLFTIASGGSVGREGAMVQLAATAGSAVGRITGLPAPRLRLLVACASAGGIAAVYNAPVAGALFVAEILLGSIAMESFGPIVFSAVMGAMTARYLGGQRSYFTTQNFKLGYAWELGPCTALAAAMGAAAPLLARWLESASGAFARVLPNLVLRLSAGGLLVGLISCLEPAVRGNGQGVVDLVLKGRWSGRGLLGLLAAKLAATTATVGSGAVGGIFTPTLLLGAMAGSAFGDLLHRVIPSSSAPAAYGLVAMGALIAGTTRAPLMSMLMLFEMTLDYDVVLPVMLGCVTAHAASNLAGGGSIYASSLPKSNAKPSPAESLRLAPLVRPSPATIRPDAPFSELAARFLAQRRNNLFVVDATGRLMGTVALHDIKEHLQETELAVLVTAGELARPVVTAHMGMSLADAAEASVGHDGEHLPVVVSANDMRLAGEAAKTDILLGIAHG